MCLALFGPMFIVVVKKQQKKNTIPGAQTTAFEPGGRVGAGGAVVMGVVACWWFTGLFREVEVREDKWVLWSFYGVVACLLKERSFSSLLLSYLRLDND